MSDVRALLKAKREENRVVHPLAAYNQAGQLRCIACAIVIKHSSAWNGHLGSKSHRTIVARLKEEGKTQGKRKVHDEDGEADGEDLENGSSKKRRVDDNGTTLPPNTSAPGFPSDFFSDPTRTLPIGDSVDSDEEDKKERHEPAVTAAAPQPQSTLELEWANFQEAVINAPAKPDAHETFERATIFAEPQLLTEIPEGFPSSVALGSEPQSQPTPTLNEQMRSMRDEDEKELIMDRLLDEERAQEEADERVNALKAKVEMLKQKRIAAKVQKLKK